MNPPTMQKDRPDWLLTLALIFAAAASFYFSTGLETWWPLAWVAPVPVLFLALRTSTTRAGLAAVAAYFLGGFNMFGYLTLFVPAPLVLTFMLFPAVVFAGAVLAARYASFRLTTVAAAVVFPCFWTAYEFLLSRISPHGTWGSLAYTQTDFLPLLQIVSLTGIWGIAFILTLIPSSLAFALARRRLSVLILPVAAFVLAVGYGALRLHRRAETLTVRVGLAATDSAPGDAFVAKDTSEALSVARDYAGRIRRLAAEGAQVVVLPEKFVGATAGDLGEISKVFSDAARDSHVSVIAGINVFEPAPPRNLAMVFSPSGELEVQYDKRHMLPGPETGYVVGSRLGLFNAAGVPWGVEICKDLDFQPWSRAYARSGVRVLAVPAWDFVRDGRLHSRMAVMRAVENGLPLVRAARQGLLTVSDGYGRIVAEIPSSSRPEAMLVQDVSLGPGETFYTRHGDWFGWVCVITALTLLAASFRSPAGNGHVRR
jgi:apolipoprotein N-acyltransferase